MLSICELPAFGRSFANVCISTKPGTELKKQIHSDSACQTTGLPPKIKSCYSWQRALKPRQCLIGVHLASAAFASKFSELSWGDSGKGLHQTPLSPGPGRGADHAALHWVHCIGTFHGHLTNEKLGLERGGHLAKVKALRTEELRAHTCSKAPAIAHLAHHLSKTGLLSWGRLYLSPGTLRNAWRRFWLSRWHGASRG